MTLADVGFWIKNNAVSVLLTLVPNLFLLYAVLFLGLDPSIVVLTYWVESLVVGAYTLVGILVVARTWKPALAFAIFFVFHFGMFMGVHLIFLLVALEIQWSSLTFALLVYPLLCILGMFILHGTEYVHDFSPTIKVDEWMMRPYKRVIVMHLLIIFGFFLLRWIGLFMVLGSILVALKIVIDIVLLATRRAATGS